MISSNLRGSVFALALSSDDRYAVSASADKSIKVWDLKERLNVFALEEAHSGTRIELLFIHKILFLRLR